MQNRAWSTLEIKSVDSEQRVIEGIASTPSPDHGGHVLDPAGAQFRLPMPFLWFHNQRDPIGEVFSADVRPEGIYIKARVSKVDKPSRLKSLVDDAWAAFTASPPLVRGLSIGWNELESEPIKGTQLQRFTKWFWGELSAVTVPMNTDATILSVKAADVRQVVVGFDNKGQEILGPYTPDLAASGLHRPALESEIVVTLDSQEISRAVVPHLSSYLAATGPHPPGATGLLPVVRAVKGARAMTTPEQITQFSNDRAAKAAQMNAIMAVAGEKNETLDAEQTQNYDELSLQVKSIDAHLARLRDQEKLNLVTATPITATTSEQASAQRGGDVPVIHVKKLEPKGTAFTRMCIALASSKGDSYQAMHRAESYKDSPEVALMTKAAIAAGSTTDATWAGPLAVAQPLVDEFLELLRPRTLLGQIPGLRQVPFNVSVPAQTTGGTYAWVGQNKPKPVTKADYATISVPFAKAAGIIVLTEELVKLSSPSAEALVREEMIGGMSQFLDTQFTDPAITAVANVNPAAITVGASTAAASGVTGAAAKADLAASVAVFTAAGIPLAGSVWLMSDSNAWGISISLNALGQPLFPGMSAQGGTLFGMPVIVSNNVSNRVVLVHAPSILFADEGGVRIDVSREASIQMDSAPTDTVDATTVYISLWQRNLVGLRAERMITWIRARTAAVRYITAAAYIGT